MHGEEIIAGEPQDADRVVATLDGGIAEYRTRGSDSGATYGGKALRRSAGNGGFLDGGTAEHRTKRRGDRYIITVNKTRR